MVLWFACLSVTGVLHIVQQPAILAALDPSHAWNFLMARGWKLFAGWPKAGACRGWSSRTGPCH